MAHNHIGPEGDTGELLSPVWQGGGASVAGEMTDSRCAECAIVDQLREQYEADYERKAAEMRRMINQAAEQLDVSVREIQQLQARVRELEGE